MAVSDTTMCFMAFSTFFPNQLTTYMHQNHWKESLTRACNLQFLSRIQNEKQPVIPKALIAGSISRYSHKQMAVFQTLCMNILTVRRKVLET